MIQIILLIAVLISVWLGILQDYDTRKIVEDFYEYLRDDLRDMSEMYDDLARYDSLEELKAAQDKRRVAVDDGHLFNIEL